MPWKCFPKNKSLPRNSSPSRHAWTCTAASWYRRTPFHHCNWVYLRFEWGSIGSIVCRRKREIQILWHFGVWIDRNILQYRLLLSFGISIIRELYWFSSWRNLIQCLSYSQWAVISNCSFLGSLLSIYHRWGSQRKDGWRENCQFIFPRQKIQQQLIQY